MSREVIHEKLQRELNRDIREECQVVYILSRIRKILEIKQKKKTYEYLNFYCNWALHGKLDRLTGKVNRMLNNMVQEGDEKFFNLQYFFDDLKNFLKDEGLSEEKIFEHENYLRFVNLLVEIYVDTPLEIPSSKNMYLLW